MVFHNKVVCWGEYLGKEGEHRGSWRTVYDYELHNSQFSPNIIEIIKTMLMRWVEHLTSVDRKRIKLW